MIGGNSLFGPRAMFGKYTFDERLDFYGLLEEVEKEAEALWKWANEGLGGEAPSCYNPVFEKYYDGRC
jgi:hypothetical protein